MYIWQVSLNYECKYTLYKILSKNYTQMKYDVHMNKNKQNYIL